MTDLRGVHHFSLSVTDRAGSASWYRDVLGFEITRESVADGFERTFLHHPGAGLTVTLTQHDAGSGDLFDERRTGLDHLAFAVATTAEVEAFRDRFEQLGVEHSSITWRGEAPDRVAILAFRDPDNIQFEIYAAGE